MKWIELNIFTSAAFDEDDLHFAADRLQVVVTPLARQVVDAQFLTDDQMAFQDLAHLEIYIKYENSQVHSPNRFDDLNKYHSRCKNILP